MNLLFFTGNFGNVSLRSLGLRVLILIAALSARFISCCRFALLLAVAGFLSLNQLTAIEWLDIGNWERQWAASGADPANADGRQFRVETPAEIRRTMSNEARPGDVLLMANGEWKDAEIVFEGKGTADRPIVLRAETPGEVILTGSSRLRIGGEHLIVEGLVFRDGYLDGGSVVEFRTSSMGEAVHCRFTDSVIAHYNPPDGLTGYHWVALMGRHNRVDHNRFDGMDHAGRMITTFIDEEPNYHRIDNNHFGPRTTRDTDLRRSGGAIIMIGHSFTSMHNSRTLVEKNLFDRCSGHGEIISNKSNENVHRYNTFVESRGALTLRHGDRCLVEGNWFFGNGKPGTGGVRIVNSGHLVVNNYFEGLTGRGWTPPFGIMNGQENPEVHEYFQSFDSTVVFNTFVDSEQPLVIGLGAERDHLVLPPVGFTFANNIVQGKRAPLIELRAQPEGAMWQGNILHGAEPAVDFGEGFRIADPQLVRDEDGLWRPDAGSPAVGGAEGDFSFVTTDIARRSRGDRPDVGASQTAGGSPTRGPLTPADVGPGWRE